MRRVPELLTDKEGGKGLLTQSHPLKRWEWQMGEGCALPSHIIGWRLEDGAKDIIHCLNYRRIIMSPENAGKQACLLRGSQAFGTLTCK